MTFLCQGLGISEILPAKMTILQCMAILSYMAVLLYIPILPHIWWCCHTWHRFAIYANISYGYIAMSGNIAIMAIPPPEPYLSVCQYYHTYGNIPVWNCCLIWQHCYIWQYCHMAFLPLMNITLYNTYQQWAANVHKLYEPGHACHLYIYIYIML